MVNTEIRLIIFFTAKDGEALYSQQKQDQELTVAQIMNSLLVYFLDLTQVEYLADVFITSCIKDFQEQILRMSTKHYYN